MKLLLLICGFSLLANFGNAQVMTHYQTEEGSSDFSSNPNQTDSDESKNLLVTNYLKEVYLNCPQYVDSLQIARGVEFMSRVVIHSVAVDRYPECLLLSSVQLKNKCNPSLVNDFDQFDPDNFNPFKYLFSFYSTQTAFFRVDGTEFIIEIKPKN
jgi:hypothetical protein